MRITLLSAFLLLAQVPLIAQFPYTRTLEIRSGQHRPAINGIAQDHLGLLWLATDLGLLRTDGDRVEVMLRVEDGGVNALHFSGDRIYAALGSGAVVRCSMIGCDTVYVNQAAADRPIHDMLVDDQGRLWLATYGEGILILDQHGGSKRIGIAQGLRDEHVNGMALRGDGSVVAATDQGLALFMGDSVVRVLGEAEGAPDNLVMCVAVNAMGEVWAGTDRSGAFRWDPDGGGTVHLLDPEWQEGEIGEIAVQNDQVWLATRGAGMIMYDPGSGGGRYLSPADQGRQSAVSDLLVDRDGMVWWCTGEEILYRADAAILFVEEHEGLDLRQATAVCTDPSGRIWFALPNSLHHHAAAFSDEHVMSTIPIELDPGKPIVSLAATSDGTVWAGTFGGGLIMVPADGPPRRSTGGILENVLSVKARENEVWFATLQGIAHWSPDDGLRSFPLPFPGFLFDVMPLRDGSVLAATDGNGVLVLDRTRRNWDTLLGGEGTYYSLVSDEKGNAWAAGPGTGFCAVPGSAADCLGRERAPFDDDLFAMAFLRGHVIAFGSTGTLAYEVSTGRVTDVTARLGSRNVQAELNAVWNDGKGALWLASDHGLVRMRPTAWHFSDRPDMVITAITQGAAHLPLDGPIGLDHDHAPISIQFTGIHYVDPGAVRFQYELTGPEKRSQITRDREVMLTDLDPGEYLFRIRAFTGNAPGEEQWTEIPFNVHAPIWQRPWAIALAVLLSIGIFHLFLRQRDRRLRERERMEQEKVRFQLEALRSQVDPHFLFNSFNTLMELIESDAGKAVDHVEKLSQFFRNILQVRDKELITVEEELRLLETYFSLEQHRFGKAIEMHIDVKESDREKRMVPLTLQMLVENALKHNVITAERPLAITVRSENGGLLVRNPVRKRMTPARSTGFGLESITKRYAALSDTPIRSRLTDDHFEVEVPLIPAADESTDHRR